MAVGVNVILIAQDLLAASLYYRKCSSLQRHRVSSARDVERGGAGSLRVTSKRRSTCSTPRLKKIGWWASAMRPGMLPACRL